jgi:cell division protein FtsB
MAETRLRDAGLFKRNREANLERLAMAKPGVGTYSSITFFLAQSYLPENNMREYKKYLILSALSDIRSSTKDNASLTALAVQLFKEGDIERAHAYINIAFEDAAFYNSRLRLASLSNILPLINKAYDTAIQKQKAKLQTAVIAISILGLLLLLTLFYIWRQLKNLSRVRKNLQDANMSLSALNKQLTATNEELKGLYNELSETNRVKEYYIGNLLNVCSDYIDKLDVYRKTVKKMILAKQLSELLEKTKSGQLIEEEIQLFYKNFDAIFLHIYPDFVAQLNNLLLPEERVTVKTGELLTTELRIFALIRLGITDSSKIAKLLRYSVNTIYNYRAKFKNKGAVNRDEFEDLIMKIGSFSK